LILFGYLIDTMGNPNGTNSSVAWGGAPQYKELRMKKAATITQQTLDYVTMFRYVLNPVMPFLGVFAYFSHKSQQGLRDGQGRRNTI
jgi:hypothetical protein